MVFLCSHVAFVGFHVGGGGSSVFVIGLSRISSFFSLEYLTKIDDNWSKVEESIWGTSFQIIMLKLQKMQKGINF